MDVVFADAALADLDGIWRYIRADNPAAAQRVVHRIMSATNILSRFPRLGRPRDDLKPGYRSLIVGKYLVFYQVGEVAVEVMRVIHTSQDYENWVW